MARESGIEIVELQDEMPEGTMMKDRRAETTEIYSTIGVVAEVVDGVVIEAIEETVEIVEIVETVEMPMEDSQLNEPQSETRVQHRHQRRESPHQI